jgi:predicted Zn-dependent protease with MMP-like domain
MANDLDDLTEEVRITVLHETAHYFGLEEEDLERLGLD